MEAAENSDAVLTTDAGTTNLQIELEHAVVKLPALAEDDLAGRTTLPVSTAHLDAQTCVLVRRVLTAASSDPGRPALCGVHFDSEGFAATDGRRLSVVNQDLDVQPSTVPGDLLAALLASFPNGCNLATDGTAATFTDSASMWSVPLVAVRFPKYRHLIPAGKSGSDVDVAAVEAALERVSAVVGRTGTVSLTAATLGELALMAEGAGLGRIHETVEIGGSWRGSAAFHVGFLTDGFRCMDSATAVASIEGDGPLKLTGHRMTHVLMPQRVT